MGRQILSAATLGIGSVKDSMYQESARGFHELSGLHTFMFVSVLLAELPVLLGIIYISLRYIRRKPEGSPVLRALLSEWSMFVSLVIAALLGTIFFIRFLWTNQANLTTTFATQSLTICKPYLSSTEYDRIASRFAGVRSREEFIGIMTDLRSIAMRNQVAIPEFDPWWRLRAATPSVRDSIPRSGYRRLSRQWPGQFGHLYPGATANRTRHAAELTSTTLQDSMVAEWKRLPPGSPQDETRPLPGSGPPPHRASHRRQ
jgi:hypothetical protein